MIDGNSHRGFRAVLRKHYTLCHKKFEIPFSVILKKDKAKREVAAKGDPSAQINTIDYGRKRFVGKKKEITCVHSEAVKFVLTTMKKDPSS